MTSGMKRLDNETYCNKTITTQANTSVYKLQKSAYKTNKQKHNIFLLLD